MPKHNEGRWTHINYAFQHLLPIQIDFVLIELDVHGAKPLSDCV